MSRHHVGHFHEIFGRLLKANIIMKVYMVPPYGIGWEGRRKKSFKIFSKDSNYEKNRIYWKKLWCHQFFDLLYFNTFKKKKCQKKNAFLLLFPILGGCDLTRALQSSLFQISGGGVPWAWRTEDGRGRKRTEEIFVSNLGLSIMWSGAGPNCTLLGPYCTIPWPYCTMMWAYHTMLWIYFPTLWPYCTILRPQSMLHISPISSDW